ncbi:CDP-diacylglycerol--glycerol-3-phosphate 3-phosphatidyltransferase [Pyrococcus sp. NA2]|uniref:archaetidylinositol phosphate synthase n=1 Tax=Pyrococcus sp. (strain NA2) TaxID=342949 RepID=UPI000209AAE5|nr:archaetidylinositol phosphate synthase [Pyrococcus sp. NA2]AEC52007.1 CDP-diacylglycerol--glycerol-3-phosphate 3-phosphatidyltransferase [Pyrococcus sp. NA2]
MLSRIRPKVKEPLERIGRGIAKAGITPNQLTLLGFLITLFASYEFYLGNQIIAALILGIGAFLDALDGAVARATNRVSKFGGFLDSTLDRLSDGVIFLGIALGGLVDWRIAFLALMGSYMVSYARCRAELAGSGTLAIGIAERGERLIIIFITALLKIVQIGVYLVALLSWMTFLQRVHEAKKRLS